jgi:ubiquinone/menaquinone biosynthesis C-methylase UbiE
VKAYYHARAPEYDDWWLGTGGFADVERPGWHEEREVLERVLAALSPARTLDLACGTGMLTQHLPGEIVGLDQSDAMLEHARRRVPAATFVTGDALDLLLEDESFDRVFSSFFYCHLEDEDRLRFLFETRRVARELVIVGARRRDGSPSAEWQERRLADGSRWQVFKRLFDPDALARELGGGELLHVGHYFVVVQSPRA